MMGGGGGGGVIGGGDLRKGVGGGGRVKLNNLFYATCNGTLPYRTRNEIPRNCCQKIHQSLES